MLFGRQLYPRYIFFMTLSLFPLASYSLVILIERYKNPVIGLILCVLAFSYFWYGDFTLITKPTSSSIPEPEKGQYLTGWPSGGGVNESIAFFREEAAKRPIVIATEGTFGLLPFAYEVYLIDNPNITIKSYWPIKDRIPQELLTYSQNRDTYIVFYQECPPCAGKGLAPSSWPLTQVYQLKKEQPDTYFTIYKVIPQ